MHYNNILIGKKLMKAHVGHRKYDKLLVDLLHEVASYKLREELIEYFSSELFELSSCDIMFVLDHYKHGNISSIDDIDLFSLYDRNEERDLSSQIRKREFKYQAKEKSNIFHTLNQMKQNKNDDIVTYHTSSKMIDFSEYFIPHSEFIQKGWMSIVYLPRATQKHPDRYLLLWYKNYTIDKIPDSLSQDERVLYLFGHYYELASFNIKNKAKIIYEQRMELLKALVPSMISHEIFHRTVTVGASVATLLQRIERIKNAQTLEDVNAEVTKLENSINDIIVPTMDALKNITGAITKLTKQATSETVNVHDVLAEAILIMNSEVSRLGINISLTCADVRIQTDRALLMHLVMNFISNSKEAYEGMTKDDKIIDIYVDSSEIANLNIYVSDNAKGIPSHIKEKLFDEGFSTKDDGNGLGLAICTYISGFLGGSVRLVDYKKYKTTFEISLPKDAFKFTTLKGEIGNG